VQREEVIRGPGSSPYGANAVFGVMALASVRQSQGLLPICPYCKRIRNDQNY
jgi:outer membrane cobalamin receptor